MKKFLALAMALILAFSFVFVSCDEVDGNEDELEEINEALKEAFSEIVVNVEQNGDGFSKVNGMTPEELFSEASDIINAATNVTLVANQDINIHMEYNGETISQSMSQSIIQKYDGNDFSIKSSNSMGTDQMECQYVDGMVYNVQLNNGMKIKYSATVEQLEAMIGVNPNENKIFSIPESWFKGITFHEDVDSDTYYIEFALDGNQYQQMMNNMNLFDNIDINSVSDIKYTVHFTRDGEIASMVSTCSVNIEGVIADYVTTTVCRNIGNTVVEAPADPDSYMLVDVSQVG